MKEWKALLDYKDNYVYIMDKEEVNIIYNERAERAKELYEKFLSEVGDLKWEFDMALDCIRNMTDECYKIILKNMDYSAHHMGLGMCIRNQYIHKANKHMCLMADDESHTVFKIILTILHPYYDFRNKTLVSLYEDYDFNRMKELGGEDFETIIEERLIQAARDPFQKSKEEIIDELKKELRNVMGADFFVKQFSRIVLELRERDKLWGNKNRIDFQNAVYRLAVLFPMEYKQIVLLRETDLFGKINNGTLGSIAECKQYIDENVGLKDDYAAYMAKCAFEAFYRNNEE